MNKLMSLDAGTPLDIPSGITLKSFENMAYYEVIPENATTNLPLIIVT